MRVGRDGPKQSKMEAGGGERHATGALGFAAGSDERSSGRGKGLFTSGLLAALAPGGGSKAGGAPRQPAASAAEGSASIPRGTSCSDPGGSWK